MAADLKGLSPVSRSRLKYILTEQNREDGLAAKATITSDMRLRRSEVLGSLRHYLQAQSQGNHMIDRLEDVERRSVP